MNNNNNRDDMNGTNHTENTDLPGHADGENSRIAENKRSKSKRLLQVFIPLLILLTVASIWIFKNAQNRPTDTTKNPDFVLTVTEPLDLEKLKSYGLPILIEFGADWCDPCRQMAPIIESLNAELQGKAIVRFVNVDNAALAEGFPISVIPTQLFIDSNGKPYVPAESNPYRMKTYSLRDTEEHVYTTHEGTLTGEDLTAILKEMGMK